MMQAAKYFLAQASEDAGDLISNLKLQKLVYYAQGFHLALYDEPLFLEAIEAWTHGPVVPDLYRHYKKYVLVQFHVLNIWTFRFTTKKLRACLMKFTLCLGSLLHGS